MLVRFEEVRGMTPTTTTAAESKRDVVEVTDAVTNINSVFNRVGVRVVTFLQTFRIEVVAKNRFLIGDTRNLSTQRAGCVC